MIDELLLAGTGLWQSQSDADSGVLDT